MSLDRYISYLAPRVSIGIPIAWGSEGRVAYIRLENNVSAEVATVKQLQDTANELFQIIQGFVKDHAPTTPPSQPPKPMPTSDMKTPTSTSPPTPGSVAAVTDQMLTEQLDKLAWKENSNGKGWHTRLDDLPQPFRGALVNKFMVAANEKRKTVMLNGFDYSRFGYNNEWLGKFGKGAQQQ